MVIRLKEAGACSLPCLISKVLSSRKVMVAGSVCKEEGAAAMTGTFTTLKLLRTGAVLTGAVDKRVMTDSRILRALGASGAELDLRLVMTACKTGRTLSARTVAGVMS